MKQKTKYPKAAKAIGGVALFLIVLGFKASALFVLGGFLGLVAIILALGPDQDVVLVDLEINGQAKYLGDEMSFHNGKWQTRFDSGESLY